ncbi:hypothetical protein N5P37_005922 [Trichoderma harzianum]|nr:hypothetical protein N5P37_005922 [Trichoderma harzianum]
MTILEDDVCFHEDCWVLRSTDKQGSKIEALQLFTDATSQAKIFVANINIMATGVNLHDACRVGVIVSQHFNPKRNLQIHERLNRLGQKHVVIWHCLKVKNSFHDHQDRQTALPGSLPEKKHAQLSAIARDEETAMMKAEREKNTGPEADQDISMEKLRDMRDQLGYQTLATVSIAN